MRTSDAVHRPSTRRSTLLLVRSFAPYRELLRPLLTSRSDFASSPFQARGEISPGKNALLHCTTAGFTPLRLDHKSFAVSRPLALLGSALYPILVHRLADSLHASSPRSVTLPQLHFASFAVVSLRRDLHPQEYAHAGRTKKRLPRSVVAASPAALPACIVAGQLAVSLENALEPGPIRPFCVATGRRQARPSPAEPAWPVREPGRRHRR